MLRSKIFCGIDLSIKRSSSIAKIIVEENSIKIKIDKRNTLDEIIDAIGECNILSIDAPFTLSRGYREVEKIMIRRGLRVFPPSFIRDLVIRNLELLEKLKQRNYEGIILETHPRSSERLSRVGSIIDLYIRQIFNKDDKDAIICALTSLAYELGEYEVFKAEDGEIYVLSGDLDKIKEIFSKSVIIIQKETKRQ
ncbi:MAG: DUF429 domain-containing protein [Sulfolobales archaeon]